MIATVTPPVTPITQVAVRVIPIHLVMVSPSVVPAVVAPVTMETGTPMVETLMVVAVATITTLSPPETSGPVLSPALIGVGTVLISITQNHTVKQQFSAPSVTVSPHGELMPPILDMSVAILLLSIRISTIVN
jgi:hypothetical protein